MATVVSKRYDSAAGKVEAGRAYALEESVALLKECEKTTFSSSPRRENSSRYI